MKSEKEIREEIEATKRTMSNYRKAFKEGKITKDILKSNILDCNATVDALRWVLGENDRYD